MTGATARYSVTTTGSGAIRSSWGPTATLECEQSGDTVVYRWRTTAAKVGERSVVITERWTDTAVVRTGKELFLGSKRLTRCDFDPPLPVLSLPPQPGATEQGPFVSEEEGTFTSTVEHVDGDVVRFTTVAQTENTRDDETWWLDLATRLPAKAVWRQEFKGFFGFSGKGEITLERLSPDD